MNPPSCPPLTHHFCHLERNAVADAAGVRITDLPITAEKVLRGMKAKGQAQ